MSQVEKTIPRQVRDCVIAVINALSIVLSPTQNCTESRNRYFYTPRLWPPSMTDPAPRFFSRTRGPALSFRLLSSLFAVHLSPARQPRGMFAETSNRSQRRSLRKRKRRRRTIDQIFILANVLSLWPIQILFAIRGCTYIPKFFPSEPSLYLGSQHRSQKKKKRNNTWGIGKGFF